MPDQPTTTTSVFKITTEVGVHSIPFQQKLQLLASHFFRAKFVTSYEIFLLMNERMRSAVEAAKIRFFKRIEGASQLDVIRVIKNVLTSSRCFFVLGLRYVDLTMLSKTFEDLLVKLFLAFHQEKHRVANLKLGERVLYIRNVVWN